MKRASLNQHSPAQGGLALPAVLWIIVALMLMVSSYSLFSRVETRMASAQIDQAKASALALGGLEYVQILLAKFPPKPGQQNFDLSLGDAQLHMTLTSAAGLIDLNKAPAGLLDALLRLQGCMDDESA